jgi:ribosome maturation factor RimP
MIVVGDVVGIGTKLKLGKVVSITRNGVVVDCQGKKVNVTFSQVESEVFGG